MKGFKILNCAITIIALVAIIVFCVIGFSFNMHGEYNDIFDRPGHHQIFTDTYKVSLLHPDTRGIVLFPLQAFFIGAIILAVISCGSRYCNFLYQPKTFNHFNRCSCSCCFCDSCGGHGVNAFDI
jgi:hypothetical protein